MTEVDLPRMQSLSPKLLDSPQPMGMTVLNDADIEPIHAIASSSSINQAKNFEWNNESNEICGCRYENKSSCGCKYINKVRTNDKCHSIPSTFSICVSLNGFLSKFENSIMYFSEYEILIAVLISQ